MKLDRPGTAYQVQALFVGILTITITAAFGLASVYRFLPAEAMPSIHVMRSIFQIYVLPEPRERFVFLSLAITVPVLSLFLVCRRPWGRENSFAIDFRISQYLPYILAVLLFFPLIGSDFTATVMGQYGVAEAHTFWGLVCSVCLSTAWCWWFIRSPKAARAAGWAKLLFCSTWFIFISLVALQAFSWRVVSINATTAQTSWNQDLNAAIYALTQVVAGKTLIADLPSQYGLFPEMLAPLFRLIGLSVIKLSVLFAVMQLAALGGLFYVLSCLLKSRFLLIVSGLALIMGTFETWGYIAGVPDPYYQYWPIRFFWPAISVLAFYRFSIKRTLWGSAVVSLVGVIGLLWNLETGLFIVVAHGAYLITRLIISTLRAGNPVDDIRRVRWPVRNYINAIVLHTFVTVFVAVVFLAFLRWKAHEPLDLYWLLKYQGIFYKLGFAMLPLPLYPHPWMSILGIYLLGLLSSMVAWHSKSAGTQDDLIFYLSMLGLGLFIYYQGRSHVLVLMCVYWPAILISVMMAERMLRAVRRNLLPYSQLSMPIAGIAFLMLSAISFLGRIPRFWDGIEKQYATLNSPNNSIVGSEILFIRSHAKAGRGCLIFSRRQGIYYAESGLSSPVKGPGIAETILQADENRMVGALLSGKLPCVFLGVASSAAPAFKVSLPAVMAAYKLSGKNQEGTMLYLTPKQ